MSRLVADSVFKCYCHPAAAWLLSLGVWSCEQTPWPHRSRPLRRPWRATSPASPRRSWATSWRTNTCATAATTYSDDRSRPSVDIASAPTASTGQWGEQHQPSQERTMSVERGLWRAGGVLWPFVQFRAEILLHGSILGENKWRNQS